MICTICEANDWENIDHVRISKKGMSICKGCGFISYPEKDGKDLKDFYHKEYRGAPTVNNAYTSQRKIHYHAAFLQELFLKWDHEKKESPVIGEVGSAYGAFLNYLKNRFPRAELFGTEWGTAYRRVAYHEFGLELTEELDFSRKYDLIVSYRVAEHQLDVAKQLTLAKTSLNEGGYFYISVPTWFDLAEDFGREGLDLEFYYDPAHVNVWTRFAFEFLLKKVGFQVVKENHTFYNDTYLCKRNDTLMTVPQFRHDYKEVKEWAEALKDAYIAYVEGNFDKAIKIWPRFPAAHSKRYEMIRASVHSADYQEVRSKVVAPFLEVCPESVQSHAFAADLAIRYEKFNEAIQHLEKCLELRPANPSSLAALSHVLRKVALTHVGPERVRFFSEARAVSRHLSLVSRQHEPECISWIYSDDAEIPTPSELESLK